ncbi:MAG: type II secretion system protein [Tissierellia bacterium]|nr:type II secretion system protein [Tissierellia bacterium]
MKRLRGFTLIETIVALAVLAMIAISVLPAFYAGFTNSSNAQVQLEQAAYGEMVMESVKSQYFEGGELELPPHPRFHYTVDTEDLGVRNRIVITINGEGNETQLELQLPKENWWLYAD